MRIGNKNYNDIEIMGFCKALELNETIKILNLGIFY